MKYVLNLMTLLVAALAVSFTNIKPDKTLSNLQKAYQAEANASRKYEQYAKAADKEGQEAIANLFRAVSQSESVHMKNHKEAIEKLGGKPEKIQYEEVKIGTTEENLRGPIEGEKTETESLYPEFVTTAKKEKADIAVQTFTYAMNAEAQHEKLFEKALMNLGKNEPADYYVSNISGETIEVSTSAAAPEGKLKGEKYIKIN